MFYSDNVTTMSRESSMNIFDSALHMERDGANLYESLADTTPAAELKTIFSLMASVEREHYKKISALKNRNDYKSFESDFLAKAQNVFKIFIQSGNFECAVSDNDCYSTAIKFEEHSIKFYEEAASNERDENVKKLLLKLAQEEREHLAIVENIYDFVESPKNYLKFTEFSNLKQY